MLTIADIIEALTSFRPPNAEAVITEGVIDSRQVIPASLFIAIPGEKVDGHDYIQDAFRKGASFALIQHEVPAPLRTLDLRSGLSADSTLDLSSPLCLRVDNTISALQQIARFWRRKLDLKVIGITGSVGKSTTKEAVADMLGVKYRTLRSPGNLNNEIGLPLTMLKLGKGYERAVLEMGFYVPGEIQFLCDIALPHIGVVSNVGTVHAERAGSQEAIARGKSELIQALPESGVAILNFDDPWVRKMEEKAKARVFFYGLSPEADLWADHIEGLGLDGIRFQLHHKKETVHVRVPMIGRHSVHTALRAASVGLNDGLNWEQIIEGLSHGTSQLRLVVVRSRTGALILDDTYNASPESMLAALNLLDELDGRKIAVLGDMLELGPYEKQGHEMVGMRTSQVVKLLITYGPRAHMIAAAAKRAGMKPANIMEFEELDPIVSWLDENLTTKDAVLIKGSHGLHMERITAALEVRS
jgi:UDP-N-acetylmuramoyl-tripeptide--D-alanyl-D-alanine ligase